MSVTHANKASELFTRLNGVLCVHKPAGWSTVRCVREVRHKLSHELSAFHSVYETGSANFTQLPAECRHHMSPTQFRCLVDPATQQHLLHQKAEEEVVVGQGESTLATSLVPQRPTFACPSHLYLGAAFHSTDLHVTPLCHLGPRVSGVCLLALNSANTFLSRLRRGARLMLREYLLTARLGVLTDTRHAHGKCVATSRFTHVTRAKLEHVLAALEASHQRHAYEYSGHPVQSQSAYEIASRGLPRACAATGPTRHVPLIYRVRCVQYCPPFFALRVLATGLSEPYLLELVHELGRQLKCLATAVNVACVAHGPFHREMSLLAKHWTLMHVRRMLSETVPLVARHMWLAADKPFVDVEELEDFNRRNCDPTDDGDDDMFGKSVDVE